MANNPDQQFWEELQARTRYYLDVIHRFGQNPADQQARKEMLAAADFFLNAARRIEEIYAGNFHVEFWRPAEFSSLKEFEFGWEEFEFG